MPALTLNDLLSTLSKENTPENIAQLENYLHTHSPADDQPGLLVRFLVDMIEQLPGMVQATLYGILCDKTNPLRQMVSSTLTTQGTSIATTALVAGLGSLISGPVAGLIAGVVVKLIAESADQDFSAEINRARAEHKLAQLEKDRSGKLAVEMRKPVRRVLKSSAAGSKSSRKRPANEPQTTNLKKTTRSEWATVQPTRAKKPSSATPKVSQRPAASSKQAPVSKKTSTDGQPARKSTPHARPKPAPKRVKKDKTSGERSK